jgi:nucleotide-binding universal stress UspA family protein
LASESALPTAIGFARDFDGRLYLLRVLATPELTTGASVVHRAAVQRAERYLAATRERLATEGIVDVSTAVWCGSPAAAIVKAAELIEAHMIIMASSGRTGAPRQLVGSVVERVLRGTKRPVLVVTPAEAVVDISLGDARPLPDDAAAIVAASSSPTPRTPDDRRPPSRGTYLDAMRNVQEREREVLRVITTIQEAAKRLERWQAVHVTHAGAGFPKEVTMTGRMIDAASWPTGRQLGDTLAAWHSATEAARVTWAHIPHERRADLPPPP